MHIEKSKNNKPTLEEAVKLKANVKYNFKLKL